MADDDAEKIFSSSSSRPFTVRSGCKFIELSHRKMSFLFHFVFAVPFVFLPSAFAEGFTFVNHPGDGASPADEQATSDSTEKKTTDEDEDEDDEDERGM